MPSLRNSTLAALGVLLLGTSACSASPAETDTEAEAAGANLPAGRLGLMTSLPLYWPLGAGVDDIASGRAGVPWQRAVIEKMYTLAPLDTLSPLPGLTADAPETDPLAEIERLAIIQPRGLSPADNVALDAWVRGGGLLLLVLDPALTGEYDLPLGDPRRPVDAALIPAVVARWGLAVSFDEAQASTVTTADLGGVPLPLALAGQVTIIDPEAAQCTLLANSAAARCEVGKGRVTLIADAALFEHPELAGEDGAALRAVIEEAVR